MRNREPSPTPKTPGMIAGATPRQAYGYLAVIIATWAGNWPMMRLALAHTEPMVFVSLRMAGSIAILAPILAALSCPLLPVRREPVSPAARQFACRLRPSTTRRWRASPVQTHCDQASGRGHTSPQRT